MKFSLTIVVLLVFCVPAMLIAQTAQPPTLADIKADYDAAKYQDVIKKSLRVLSVKGEGVKQPDRGAIEAFTAAAKDSTDQKDVGLYRATALLIKRSPGAKYSPKASADAKEKPEPIDIIVADSRKKAFTALYTDEAKSVQAKVDSVKTKQALKPIMDVVREVLDFRAVELAGTDADDGSKKMLAEISDQTAKLMGEGIKTLGATVDRIAKTANETYTSTPSNNAYGRGDTVVSKRGLSQAWREP